MWIGLNTNKDYKERGGSQTEINEDVLMLSLVRL